MTLPEPPPTLRESSPTMRGMCGRVCDDATPAEIASDMPREMILEGERIPLVWVPIRGVGGERGPRQ